MDTKLKRFNDKILVRVLAFVLCSVLFILSLGLSAYMINSFSSNNYIGNITDLFKINTYQESDDFISYNYNVTQMLVPLAFLKSEKNIRNGNTITEQRMADIEEEFFYNGMYTVSDGYRSWTVEANNDGPTSDEYQYGPTTLKMFREANKEAFEEIKKSEINNDLSTFNNYIQHLNSIKGLSYYASDGKNYISNLSSNSTILSEGAKSVKENFKKNPAYIFFDNGKVTGNNDMHYVNRMEDEINSYVGDWISQSDIPENYKIYYTFDESFFAEKNKALEELSIDAKKILPALITSVLLSLILFIYLLVTTGRKDENGNIKLYKLDKLFIEVQAIGIFATILISSIIGQNMITQRYYYTDYVETVVTSASITELTVFSICLLPLAFIGLWFVLSIVRNIKAGLFWKRSLIGKIFYAIFNSLKSIFNGGSAMRKVVIVALSICLLSATIFLAPVVFIVLLIFAPKIVGKYEAVKKGIHEVKSGNLSYKIPVEGDGEFDRLARDVNDISEASNVAIQNELKNQRLKTELISNVSHDLKTPLTSIITYIDLLKQEGLHCEEAPKYLDILDQKAARLKNLTEDLFEAAKASSGDIPVRFESVDIVSVIKQSLGEFSDRIDEANLEFKLTNEQEKYYVNADRQLLWRVIENLFGNVIKYAQEGSRVYIDVKNITSNSPIVVMEIKNISKSELNIHADELMERFKRGDESRTTEGSGLGLAIAKDLVRLQNGWFEIKIDGDLFKAIVMLEVA